MTTLLDIPPEILEEIFYLTIRGPVSNVQDSLFPWNLNRVCKSWRRVFISCPKLWAFIALDGGSPDIGMEEMFNWFLLCLQRSGDRPLSLIILTPGEDESAQGSWILAWNAILSCSHRWKNIFLLGDASHFRDLAIQCKGGFPLLQSLTLGSPHQFDCDAFHDVPHLKQLSILFGNEVVSHTWSYPLSQLTKFTLGMDEVSSEILQVLLENLRSIEELRFVVLGCGREVDISPFPPRRLEYLRVLEVPFYQILQVIQAPSLIELVLVTSDELYPTGADGYEMFDLYKEVVETFVDSSCRLRKLGLTDFTMEQAEPLISSFPDVEELCLDWGDGSPTEVLDLLAEDDDEQESTAFPNLRILTMTCEPGFVKDLTETLTTILELRNGAYIGKPPSIPVKPLEKIIIRRRQSRSPLPDLRDSEPIPDALRDALRDAASDWALFKVDVQFHRYQE